MIAKADSKDGKVKTFDTLSIPPFAGTQPVTGRYQRRTQLQYACLATIGLFSFYNSKNSRVRVAGLSCLFPGAGFLAVGGFLGAIGLVLSVAVIPLSLFAWFGAGGLAFVLANWIIPGIISTGIAGDTVWEPAGPIVIVFMIGLISYMFYTAHQRHSTAVRLGQKRNSILDKEDAAWKARAVPRPAEDSDRELSLEDLRLFQHFVQIAHQEMDDWSNFVRIDQFQTSALRYQLYNLQWTLAYVQKFYMPNFQGYIKEGQEKVIEKSTTEDVMNYWKWESLWGKFTLDWDPVKRDNIMMTGYMLLCLALYEKLNGDDRYCKAGSLNFRITENAQYHHDTKSIFEALMMNWDKCSYTLFPCEPNWIYTLCNLVGMQGALAYEVLNHTGRVGPLLSERYHRAFEEDFMNPDGSIVTLRSAITGFPVIGLAGVIGDISGSLACNAAMPNLARRLWLVARENHVRKNEDGKYYIDNLVGADKIDVGNYKKGSGFAVSTFANCAAEFGEVDLAKDLVASLEGGQHPIVNSPTGNGAIMNEGISMLGCSNIFKARTMKQGDWAKLINSPQDDVALMAPKLDRVPFPKVMVAKCHAVGKDGLHFVLRSSERGLDCSIGFKDLKSGKAYRLLSIEEGGAEKEVPSAIKPDANGEAQVQVPVGNRSVFKLEMMG
ncbi:uncharacterized protein PV09_04137 [Verruconis gallopava]|uniref:Linalool dehydratase/isomerase domain-containing protein n=1 Tax=Verruconis gallopava TaxID=253628 RepID=A0A0D2AEW2_9PEZI|nr:uncharacterized protein PV09_04137 [Verruconis gallopava]KIW04975.1 hypothetical protein PV09_04137 [Verruconis gallopava]